MTNSTFKPTHVRCVKSGTPCFTAGKVYNFLPKPEKTLNYYFYNDLGCVDFVGPREWQRRGNYHHTQFHYIGPPAILGEPKTITEGSPK